MIEKTHIAYLHLESVDSTQSYAKNHLKLDDVAALYCVYADTQLHGQGTFGKSWYSEKKGNLYATFAYIEEISSSFLPKPQLAQVLSCSVCKLLQSLHFTPSLKWPNDVMLSHKKLAGILCDYVQHERSVNVYVGIGMNINLNEHDVASINQRATSLELESSNSYSLASILFPLAESFLLDLNTYLAYGFKPFYDTYTSLMIYLPAPVYLNHQLIGTARNIELDGSLVIEKNNHTIEKIYSGSLDISSWSKTAEY